MRVRVYWNLHKQCFSVMDAKTRKVIEHAAIVHLTQVTFKVSEAGRQRVIKEQSKNVHAFVEGNLVEKTGQCTESAYYNPYTCSTFVDRDSKPIYQAKQALLENRRVWIQR